MLRAPAVLVAARPYGETACIVRLFTQDHGVIAAYVAGGRGRVLRPVLIPGNLVEADVRSKSEGQLPFARLELLASRGPWLSEPLPAAAIGWATALCAATLPERNPYPAVFQALSALLDAICNADAARRWVRAMLAYEALLLRELGYGGAAPAQEGELGPLLEIFALQGGRIERYLLAERQGDVMAARARLGQQLQRMIA